MGCRNIKTAGACEMYKCTVLQSFAIQLQPFCNSAEWFLCVNSNVMSSIHYIALALKYSIGMNKIRVTVVHLSKFRCNNMIWLKVEQCFKMHSILLYLLTTSLPCLILKNLREIYSLLKSIKCKIYRWGISFANNILSLTLFWTHKQNSKRLAV